MRLNRITSDIIASIMLLAVFAALFTGVFHEASHESNSMCANFSTDCLISSADEGEHCHSHHQTCSSLSCTQGSVFITESIYRWQNFASIELFVLFSCKFALPIILTRFFKPPIATAC
ncbi:MAG: hypothetical protein EOM80_11700 [Erysipelotrichia bacterium]|nr:hypothetical protein [Erysipelotrichia bacterium]